jgi:hypothetical protein
MDPRLRDDLAKRGRPPDNDHESIDFGDVRTAARILKLSTSYLNKARVTGSGPPYVKFGRAVRYHVPSLLAWAEAQTRRSTSDQEGV